MNNPPLQEQTAEADVCFYAIVESRFSVESKSTL